MAILFWQSCVSINRMRPYLLHCVGSSSVVGRDPNVSGPVKSPCFLFPAVSIILKVSLLALCRLFIALPCKPNLLPCVFHALANIYPRFPEMGVSKKQGHKARIQNNRIPHIRIPKEDAPRNSQISGNLQGLSPRGAFEVQNLYLGSHRDST